MMKTGEIMRNRIKNNKGFTLIEVITVLIILAILSAVVISRGMSTADVNLQVEADTLKSHIRYAQYLAMNENDTDTTNNPGTRVKWGIEVNSTYYTLIKDVTGKLPASSYSLPGESSAIHNFATGITATKTGTVLFDEWGRPYFASNILPGVSRTTIITLGPGPQSIEIYPETGFIQ